ncbi:MAG: lipase [Clostridium sp.]
MKKAIIISLIICFFLISTSSLALANQNNASKANDYPIVFLHGFMGWGEKNSSGENYFGGEYSIIENLNNSGYKAFSPDLGSLASNWDRACELYAYLVGGKVDYGKSHSEKCGHDRYGKTYPGVMPKFQENNQKIHLIGHSMGGLTARLFAHLLKNGSQDEIQSTPSNELSPLFKGGNSNIFSITTIQTPHNGSQDANNKGALINAIKKIVFPSTSSSYENPDLNDLKLDQWGISRKSSKSYKEYIEKILASDAIRYMKDFGMYDLTPEACRDFNERVPAIDDIYYFSLSTQDTYKSRITGFHYPNKGMRSNFVLTSLRMGMETSSKENMVPITNEWWANDGVVSVISAKYPILNSKDEHVEYKGNPKPGVWNYLGNIQNTDHLDTIRDKKPNPILTEKYLNLANMLQSLN